MSLTVSVTMKLTLVFLAALAVVAISRPQSEIPENMSMIDGLTKYSPPIISNAINSFSQKGKDALTKIDEASEEFRKAGKTFCADKFAAMLKELSPEDYQKLVDAGKELESEVRKLSQPIQDLFKKGKAMWTTGNAATAEELKEITEAVKNLTPDDQEAYFKLMPVAKKFLETVSA
ncbi:hypothetical protein L596_023204 [Steinernema carpocapsae]|uniref:Fatty-acid and retinol-binding protein 1 n=1 Tax=Steinernema carpocapsae TaxID=34508 RepID=A0A4U5MCY3_STECR|nr:hypothetical protein L596_023204 [Steinernema carpocapsae]